MKIYDRPGFPNPARIRIVLAETGLEDRVLFVPVDLIGAQHKTQAFLAKNPSGVVPVLELDDGTLISETAAITFYLDTLEGAPTLTGRTPRERALIVMMHRRAEAEVLDAVGHYFHYATPGLGETLHKHKSPEWQGRAAWGQRERERALAGMAYFDEVLGDRPFIAGETFSMADITLFAGLLFADAAGIGSAASLASLAAWRARVAKLPSVMGRSGQTFVQEDLQRLGL